MAVCRSALNACDIQCERIRIGGEVAQHMRELRVRRGSGQRHCDRLATIGSELAIGRRDEIVGVERSRVIRAGQADIQVRKVRAIHRIHRIPGRAAGS